MTTHSSHGSPPRRVVTGHDTQGKAIITHDSLPPHVAEIEQIPGTVFYELWSTHGSPAVVGNTPDPTPGPLTLTPPPGGTRLRMVDIPPDSEDFLTNGAQRMQAAFRKIGDESASTVKADSPHPLMHRTESIDYAVVMDGEMTLILDDAETVLRTGDVAIQRGTNHAWANRSGRNCRMLFVLLDGRYDPAVALALEQR